MVTDSEVWRLLDSIWALTHLRHDTEGSAESVCLIERFRRAYAMRKQGSHGEERNRQQQGIDSGPALKAGLSLTKNGEMASILPHLDAAGF
ncbi:MAG: hypothetical protein ACOYIR_06515 [Christensenellales bacterium]|jgi:hypothetical protein